MAFMMHNRITVPAAAEKESPVMAMAKDWLAGGTAAGISKTIVAPIGHTLPSHSSHLF
jgi:hypothetical protein